ncbi:hypothetical protein KKG65_00670 [Patescibacteria group bacterium]|nr:hypothetical protein [Patescibacteria group bacterium]
MWIKRFLILAIIIRLLFLFWSNIDLYTKPYDINKSIDRYNQSQYTQGDKAKLTLSDSELYIVEGHSLVNGKDPEQMFPGHPALGKVFFGLSLKLFGNPYIISYLSFLCLVLFFYLFTNSAFLTLVITFEPLLLSQLTVSLLDIQLAVFHLLTLLSYQRFRSTNHSFKWSLLTCLFLGLSASIKFFPSSIPLFLALIVDTTLTGDFTHFSRIIKSLPATALGFLAGNFTYFVHHPSLISFAKFFRYQVNWWAGGPQAPPLGVWKIIYLNQWPTWWGDGTIQVENWWIIWPIIFSLSLFSWRSRVIYLYILCSLILFSLGIFFPRYLVPIIPFVYYSAYGTINRLWQKVKSAQ